MPNPKFQIVPQNSALPVQSDFDKRMINPATDINQYGDLSSNNSPVVKDSFRRANDDVKGFVRALKDKAANLVQGNNWSAGVDDLSKKGWQASFKGKF